MFELVKFNPWLVGCNFLMWLVSYMVVYPALREPYNELSYYRQKTAFCLLIIFTICAFWGSDWFHIYDKYHILVLNNWRLESVYHWIAANLAPNSYFLWRFIVWGLASILVWSTFNHLALNKSLAIALFLTIWMLWFSYARVSLSMALVFWGFALLHCKSFRSPYFLIGFIAILSAFYFHKSASFAIICCLIALISPLMNRKVWYLLLIFFPVVIYFARQYLSGIFLSDVKIESNEIASYIARGQDYLNLANKFQGVGYLVGQLLERIPYYMLAMTSFRIIVSDEIDEHPKDIVAFMKLLVLITFFASLFMFDLSMNTQLVYERFMRFSFIPACIVLTYCLANGIFPKWHSYVLHIAISGTVYQLIYMFYCSIMYKP